MEEDKAFEKGEAIEERAPAEEAIQPLEKEIEVQREKYLRLYAEFENYRKRAVKDRDDLLRRASEEIFIELLTTVDNLETALQHTGEGSEALCRGVEMSLRELLRTLEKFGVRPIEAAGRPFDPEYHHAISQVERDDVDDKTVVEELRKGYTYNGRVIRASLVAVSRKRRPEEASSGEVKINRE
jgi:molecular chaperone GrpE